MYGGREAKGEEGGRGDESKEKGEEIVTLTHSFLSSDSFVNYVDRYREKMLSRVQILRKI
jgi:hypothetical protein